MSKSTTGAASVAPAVSGAMCEMPLRRGGYAPLERQARELAGDVRCRDAIGCHQPWTPAIKTPISYPPRKNRPTRIPFGEDWTPFQRSKRRVWKPIKPENSWVPIAPDPEGDLLPDDSVINVMTFDDKPWLDMLPVEDQAKVGYTNFANDVQVVKPLEPGQYWKEEDRKHRKAKRQRAANASQPPADPESWLSSLRGRICKGCFDRMPEDHAKVRYCSEQCRNHSENAHRRGTVGTMRPGIELSGFAINGKLVGLATEDLGFIRLLAG